MEKVNSIRFVSYGLGEIGCSIARLALERGMKLVGAIDVDKGKASEDVGRVIGLNKKLGVIVSSNAGKTLEESRPQIVFHATTSSLKQAKPQLMECIKARANIISTCEELAFPLASNKSIASKLSDLAKKKRVRVLATGVNPGFVLDTLALALTAACQKVNSVKAIRVVNARNRRLAFQKKIGVGLTLKEFRKKIGKKLGHIGLSESAAFVASKLGFNSIKVSESIKPVTVGNKVLGVQQVAVAKNKGKPVVSLEFRASVNEKKARDEIIIDGTPVIKLQIKNGIHGDAATPAIVVNSVQQLLRAPPGLFSMPDLPLVYCRASAQ